MRVFCKPLHSTTLYHQNQQVTQPLRLHFKQLNTYTQPATRMAAPSTLTASKYSCNPLHFLQRSDLIKEQHYMHAQQSSVQKSQANKQAHKHMQGAGRASLLQHAAIAQ
jgi:hypothetical protein